MMKVLKKVVRTIKKVANIPSWLIENCLFIKKYIWLKNQKKIIYALTPPPYLKNIGDQAQVIAIRKWFDKHYPDLPVIELDKDECQKYTWGLGWLISPDDIVFLHSGGNLGDRGKWSESRRRLLISTFTQNQIVSLPQTIHFSDTVDGQKEKEKTREIYAKHPNLTIIGRDPRSGEIAEEMFPHAKTFSMPDFVLSLPPKLSSKTNNPPKIILCLRLDNESALTEAQRKQIEEIVPYPTTLYDTTISHVIPVAQREAILEKTLELFLEHDLVVTDRYHGLIFTILCQKQCVVLPTVDHKLTSAIFWFKNIPSVKFANNIEEIPNLVEENLKISVSQYLDWNLEYFDKIPQLI